MTDAQIWLNQNIPINQRADIRELHIWPDSLQSDPGHIFLYGDNENRYYVPSEVILTGTLDLSTFPYLEELIIENQFINRLVLSGCLFLRRLSASNNLLREVVWPARIITSGVELTPRLQSVYLTNNNFWSRDLSEFNRFSRLKILLLGTDKKEKLDHGIYNRWNGSLSCISNLRQLQELDINATDINDGLINLPTRELFRFTFGSFGRVEAEVNGLKAILARDLGLKEEDMEKWAAEGTYDTVESFDRSKEKIEYIQSWQQRQENRQLQTQIQVNSFR